MQAYHITHTQEQKSVNFPFPLRASDDHKDIYQKLRSTILNIWVKLRPSEDKNKEDYLQQMCYLALADHRLSKDEQAYIHNVSQLIDVKDHSINVVNEQSVKQKPRFLNFPLRDRFFYVFNLVNLIRLSEAVPDKSICRAQMILMKQGYAPDTVDIILSTIEHNEKSGISPQQTYLKLKEALG